MWRIEFESIDGTRTIKRFETHDKAEDFCDWIENMGGKIIKVSFWGRESKI